MDDHLSLLEVAWFDRQLTPLHRIENLGKFPYQQTGGASCLDSERKESAMTWRRTAGGAGIISGGRSGGGRLGGYRERRTGSVVCSLHRVGRGHGRLYGAGAAIGQEALDWAKFAVSQFNKANGTQFTLVEREISGSTPHSREPSDSSSSRTRAFLGLSGLTRAPPSPSPGPLFTRRRPSLHLGLGDAGQPHERPVPTFFRDVPNDNVQAPDRCRLHGEQASRQERRARRQPDRLQHRVSTPRSRKLLEARGVKVQRLSTTRPRPISRP